MKSRLRAAIATFVLGWMGIAAAFSQSSPMLYVHNKPYSGELLVYKGALYANVAEIFPVVNLKLTTQGRILCGTTSDYPDSPCPENASRALVFINGNPIGSGILVRHDKIYISLSSLATARGFVYRFNRQTQIADISAATPTISTSTSTADSSGGSSKKSSKSKEESKPNDNPLTVSVTSPPPDPHTNEVRATFTVKNTSDKSVEGITAILHYLDGYGKSLRDQTYSIGTLGAGESATRDDYWVTPAQIMMNPTVDLDWNGKEKKK